MGIIFSYNSNIDENKSFTDKHKYIKYIIDCDLINIHKNYTDLQKNKSIYSKNLIYEYKNGLIYEYEKYSEKKIKQTCYCTFKCNHFEYIYKTRKNINDLYNFFSILGLSLICIFALHKTDICKING